ncbi:hypothetical protein MKK88_05755 [Methylobacterium sp. E-005]|uniref:hypothetical protein n=1 Tax=Methylobacterium sp. E-005 TaxID=2836549 RepID=UPI001FBA6F6D|nr:hypothetical protein [Methylobacterium sp. E-005]MCJ2085499.1 hypothetical protein [Methylobacterium sp. E-005]
MPLRRFQPISPSAQWSETFAWRDPRTGQLNSLDGAILTLGLYRQGERSAWRWDYGRAVSSCDERPIFAAQTQYDNSGLFFIKPDLLHAQIVAPAGTLRQLPRGAVELVVWATVDGATDEIERATIQVLDGPRTLALSIILPPTLGDLTLATSQAFVGVPFTSLIVGQTAGSTITATSSDKTALNVLNGAISGTFAAAGTPTITLVETLAGAIGSPKNSQSVASITVAPTILTGFLAGQGSVTGSLNVVANVALAGAIVGAGALTGALSNASPRNLTGAIAGNGALSGALTVTAAGTTALVGTIPSGAALAGALTVTATSGLVQTRKGRIAAAMAA